MKRRGVSLLEILFAVLIVSVGLLGSIAVFVVAGARMGQAKVSDAAAVAGRSAVHHFDTQGMRRPEMWFGWNTATNALSPVFNAKTISFNGSYSAVQSYCIDSRFVCANAQNWTVAGTFPYSASTNTPGPRMNRVAFFRPLANGMPFVIEKNPTQTLAVNKLMADQIFQLDDDLTFERSKDDRTLGAKQLWDQNSSGVTKRLSDGHFSWMATLVPRITGGIGSGGKPAWSGSDSFLLSIVVFHDRPADFAMDATNERTLGVTLQAGGETGGEVLLTHSTEAALKFRSGDWLLLSGNKELRDVSTNTLYDTAPRFVWYRIVHCDPEPQAATSGFQTYATLQGADWDTSLVNVQAVAVDGVVHVYEKSIRLDYGSSF